MHQLLHLDHLVKEQIPNIKDDQILAEPVRRNTAPCILYVSQKIQKNDADAKRIVSPSEHLILKEDKFVETIAMLPVCEIGIEACGASHHWARTFEKMGHQVKMIPAKAVKGSFKG